MSDFEIIAASPADLDEFEPLWRSLYDHHVAITPHLRDRELPFEQAWAVRRAFERKWLPSEPDSFVLVARRPPVGHVGYAFVRVIPGGRIGASWSASDPLAELAVLAVLPQERGRGVGSALFDAVEARLRELGVRDMAIDVLTNNDDALRLYARRGALPFLTKLVHRVPDGSERGT